jgi:hypothetical protein
VVPLGALGLALLLAPPPAEDSLGRIVGWLSLVVASAVAASALWSFEAGKYSALLGGVAHLPTWVGFDTTVRAAGFGLYPFVGAVPFALGAVLRSQREERGGEDRSRGAGLFVLAASSLGFLATTLSADLAIDFGFVALAAPALAIGMLLDQLLDGEARPILGICIGAGTALVARDLYLNPELVAGVHVTEGLKWPIELRYGQALLAFGLGFGAMVAAALACPWRRVRELGLLGLGVAGLATAGFLAFRATPQLSKHLSFKSIFDRYHALATNKEPLAGLFVSGHGVNYYAGGRLEQLSGYDALATFLKRGCTYALVPNDQLGAIDQALTSKSVDYKVADATSSRFLLLTACPGVPDENPLRRFVSQSAPKPGRAVTASFEDKLELIGADFPDQASRARDGKFPLAMHFRVKALIPGAYKVFVHVDSPASRVIGDHVPVEGKLPTNYWSAGRYVTDLYDIEIPLMTTTPGVYTIWAGFFLGDKRLKVLSGPQDGADRVNLGTITIR